MFKKFAVLFAGLALASCESSPKAVLVAQMQGGWRMPGETAVLQVATDGSYSWGPTIRGKFADIDSARVSMSLLEHGKLAGTMPQLVSIAGDTLNLIAPDRSVMKFVRVQP